MSMVGVGHLGLALLALLVVFARRAEPRRAKVFGCSVSHAARLAVSASAVELAISPGEHGRKVSAPVSLVRLHPALESVAQICRTREMGVLRIGGLYGP